MTMLYVTPKLMESKIIQEDFPEIYDLGMKALNDTDQIFLQFLKTHIYIEYP